MLQLIQANPLNASPQWLSDFNKVVKDMRAEYHFDYSKARPNRFASKVEPAAVVVVLDTDVTEVFKTPARVIASVVCEAISQLVIQIVPSGIHTIDQIHLLLP